MMAGLVAGVLDPDRWAHTQAGLFRVIDGQLDDDALDAPGTLEWVAARRVDRWRAEYGCTTGGRP